MMKPSAYLLPLALLTAAHAKPRPTTMPPLYTVTIKVLVGQRELRVRLDGIDAPEKRQPWGTQAKQRLSALAFGRQVTLHVYDTDRYGRSIADVRDGRVSLNERMVGEGMAWAYRTYSLRYVPAEELARKTKQGLWRDSRPVPPWEFRRKRK